MSSPTGLVFTPDASEPERRYPPTGLVRTLRELGGDAYELVGLHSVGQEREAIANVPADGAVYRVVDATGAVIFSTLTAPAADAAAELNPESF